jgi:hypothetical protein
MGARPFSLAGVDRATYHAAVMMEAGDVATAAACCAAFAEMSVEAWRTHTRWVIADGNNSRRAT